MPPVKFEKMTEEGRTSLVHYDVQMGRDWWDVPAHRWDDESTENG